MSDIALSLIVIALTGIFAALLFLFIAGKKAQNELGIREYCLRNGFLFSKNDAPLRKEISIKGDAFLLTSTMVSGYNDAQAGSGSWDKASIWRTEKIDADRPAFMMGSVSASLDWEHLPPMIKDAAVQALLAESKEEYSPDMARYISTGDNRAVLMFQRAPGSANAAMERMLPLLKKMPADSRVFIHSGANGITVKCSNLFIRSQADAEMLLGLGFACAGWPHSS